MRYRSSELMMIGHKLVVRAIFLISLILMILGLAPADRVAAKVLHTAAGGLDAGFEALPENIAILSNEVDAAYCKDFSPSLKWSALEWVILDETAIPDSVKNKHLLLIGQPDSQFTGDIIEELITSEEMSQIRGEGQFAVFNKVSPWQVDRKIIIASGSDMNTTRKAAEQALANLTQDVTDLDLWYADPYESVTWEEAASYMQDIQHVAQGEELAKDFLSMEVKAKSPLRVSQAEAREDVERFFYLLEYGWCGYGYFSRQTVFAQAKENILNTVNTKSRWSPNSLSELIYQHVDFVHDCHLKLGDKIFCRHLDFWFDSRLDVLQISGEYIFTIDGAIYRLLSVNDLPPDEYLFPSLNAKGSAIYRLGTLSYDPPGSLTLGVQVDGEREQLEVDLSRGEFYSDEIFGEERIGGIPVIRVRSFGDYYRGKELKEFLESANRYRGEPYLILDLRQNSGGNTDWPKNWVTRFTGHTPTFALMLSELTNRTTMMGRFNTFQLMLSNYSDEESTWVQGQINTYELRAERFNNPSMEASWSPIHFPSMRWIPNQTTLIVLMDRNVASAGEGMILYLYGQVQNVIFVGENSMGALTFGQVSNHRLPNSKLMLWLPIKLNVSQDLVFREEQGYEPDLWVPAEHALNYAVAAARNGTISTQVDLPDDYFSAEFVPEKVTTNKLVSTFTLIRWMLILIVVGAFILIVFRKQPRIYIAFGIFCLPTSVIMIAKDNPQGFWLISYGLMFIFIGVINYRKKKAHLQVQVLRSE